MARYSVNDILKFVDEEECINDVVTNGSDDELDCEDDRYATVMLYNVNIHYWKKNRKQLNIFYYYSIRII